MAQRHPHIPAVLTGLALLASPAFAQDPAVPQRACSPEDIRLALAGEYTGPPCRFTEMPAGAEAGTQVAARTDFEADVARLDGAPHTRRAERVQASRPAGVDVSRVSRPRVAMSRNVTVPAGPGPAPGPARRETVTLDDSFFTGPLTGGVERPFTPLYSYRGIVLISASGETRTGFSAVRHLTRRTHALDTHRAGPARAYPYD